MEKNIRVMVANRPRLMRELVLATIADQADIEIVGEVERDEEIANIVETTRPDLLIIALDQPGRRPPMCDSLLRQYPEMRILAVAPEGNSTVFFWGSFDIHSSAVEASEQGILRALRSARQASGGPS